MADGPSRVPLHSLEIMTDNFSQDRVIGSGSYGKVYLGKREDGQKLAVKILHDMSGHDDVQFDKEFYNLANLQHQNIVQLVGYCHETRREYLPYNNSKVLADVTKRALCFEFMENGSLSDSLFDEFNGHGWRTRYAIIKGICNGLKYLHEELKPPIFHFDLKPANILLDKNMIPKIADFGLSRFFKEEKSHSTNSPIGTLGYLPPEFIHHRIISNKLDIFSLGVVVIKIIAGPTGHCRSAEMTSEQFTEIVHGNWRNRLQSAASGYLLESYSEQVNICMEIALSCLETDRQKRPTIGDIVNMLTETETQENYHGALVDQVRSEIPQSFFLL
uniref:Protein kinase domain-containing protein n=1 Tax=Triticum urartu TaxID=4572 RepID=A0A8R7PMR1_TRIUA